MAEETQRKGLGRGLSALLGDDDPPAAGPARTPRELPIEFLRPNRFQPRQRFDDDPLDELTDSIREHGVIQPIVVRPVAGETNAYEIIAGERRWRAAQRAQISQVPVVVKDLDDSRALEVALVENVQRSDLSPVEEAKAYLRLVEDFNHTQERIAELVGKSRSHVANTVRLLQLPAEVLELLDGGKLTAGHARALLGTDDPLGLAKTIIQGGLNVRDAENLVPKSKLSGRNSRSKDADTLALEQNLSQALGLKVDIGHRGERGGTLRIEYTTLDQLDDVCRRLIQNSQSKGSDSSYIETIYRP
ncbi:MAG: ParB/RepB/Spo0J family partition protein [Alphaproteobacteria bacterium]|nr:ParB/RepB/Spo0J family partition protein [Alphaproteobacteria bacterium]